MGPYHGRPKVKWEGQEVSLRFQSPYEDCCELFFKKHNCVAYLFAQLETPAGTPRGREPTQLHVLGQQGLGLGAVTHGEQGMPFAPKPGKIRAWYGIHCGAVPAGTSGSVGGVDWKCDETEIWVNMVR